MGHHKNGLTRRAVAISSPTISRAERTSTLEKGSSSSRILGSFSSARASDIRCRMPCEYCPTGAQRGVKLHRANHGFGSIADHLRFRKAVQNNASFPFRSSRHRAVKDAPCSRSAQQTSRRSLGPEHRDASARGQHQAGQSAQQRRLPCPVVAQDGVQTARRKIAVTPRNAAKRPNCLTRFVTRMSVLRGGIEIWKIV